MNSPPAMTSRRDLIASFNPRRHVDAGAEIANERQIPAWLQQSPDASSTIRLTTRAMACDCSVIMEPGPVEQIEAASQALEALHSIEGWMSLYRESSELCAVNRKAFESPVTVCPELFQLLSLATEIHAGTDRAFDMASGTLTRLWRRSRQEQRIPLQSEIDEALSLAGMELVELDASSCGVRFLKPGVVLDPGAIGKGAALDDVADWLQRMDAAPRSYLLHGGHSSLVARGPHNGHVGWPVGIGNPLLTEKRLGTLLLCDRAMATSGSNIQFFRHEGRRYGHILDPRTGWPVEGMLSVTVVAPSAALADALSTAFFVLGVEKARLCCEKWPGVGAILLPFPEHGTKVRPTVIGLPPQLIYWDADQVVLPSV